MAITDVPEFTHLTRRGHREPGARAGCDTPGHRGLPRGARCALHPSHHCRTARAGGGRSAPAGRQLEAQVLVGGHCDARRGQDHREHGDRAQRHARAVGLDERSRDSFLDVGMGHEWRVQALAVHPQLHAPQVHQHPRHGRRCGLRRHPRHPRSALEAVQPQQSVLQHAAGDRLRVGRRTAAPGARQDLQGPR